MAHLRKNKKGQWEVRIVVPDIARPIIGKKNLTKYIGPVTKAEANRRAAPWIARFQQEIATAKSYMNNALDKIQGDAKSVISNQIQMTPYQPILVNVSENNHKDKEDKVTITNLLQLYLNERKPSSASIKKYDIAFRHFIRFLNHDDANKVTKKVIINWKNYLIDEKIENNNKTRSYKTISGSFLAFVNKVFEWAFQNELINNEIGRVKLDYNKVLHESESRPFSDREIKLILESSYKPQDNRIASSARAIRWIPWILAYSGARVGEITQLRVCDIIKIKDIWTIHITPEAGSTKTHLKRDVPIHVDLINRGFLDFVISRKKSGEQGLFYSDDDVNYIFAHHPDFSENEIYKKVSDNLSRVMARWVNALVVGGEGFKPNHGWRHTFLSVARGKLTTEAAYTITGHSLRTQGEKYGVWPIETLKAEMDKFPSYKI